MDWTVIVGIGAGVVILAAVFLWSAWRRRIRRLEEGQTGPDADFDWLIKNPKK